MNALGSILINRIKTIYGIQTSPQTFKKGAAMSVVEKMDDAFILIERGKIKDFGPQSLAPQNADHIIDAFGCLVLPCWCDSHTHIVFAEGREAEYVARLQGKSYQEIANNGGGILNSAAKLQKLSEDELYVSACQRLDEVISNGTGAIEIKSGYGLTLESELKMLRVIKRLKENSRVAIKATFLGAHAIPTIFKNDREKYIDLIIKSMMPQVMEEGLADYIDVFCDEGFFTVEETDKILNAGSKYGLKAKIHANELAISGGVQVGVANGAVSVDHLEMIGDEEIEILKSAKTIPTVLPFCSYFLNIHYAPARRMIDQGLGIAIASDYNPGSSPSGNIPLLLSMACNKMRLLPLEAFNAVTVNGAFAMELENDYGTIGIGKTASLIITKPIPSLEYMIYAFGSNHIKQVVLHGNMS